MGRGWLQGSQIFFNRWVLLNHFIKNNQHSCFHQNLLNPTLCYSCFFSLWDPSNLYFIPFGFWLAQGLCFALFFFFLSETRIPFSLIRQLKYYKFFKCPYLHYTCLWINQDFLSEATQADSLQQYPFPVVGFVTVQNKQTSKIPQEYKNIQLQVFLAHF